VDKITICLVGRRHPLKGLADFIAFWKANREYLVKMTDKVYIISDDDLSRFDLSDFELIKPSSDREIADYYNKSHIFISTSLKEGFGLPALEAMACGCASIVSDCGGISEYAADGHNCLIYEPGNRAQLKDALDTLFNSPELRKKLGMNGSVTASRFSWGGSAELLKVLTGVE
jgi:glycosyltransferase involved in cell wall biosynthesis